MNRYASSVLAVVLAALSWSRVSAQDSRPDSSSIHGTATSQSGSIVMPGVTLTLTAMPSGNRRGVVVSDSRGRFRFTDLPAGSYRLHATIAGFDDLARDGLTLATGQELEVNLDIALAISTRVDAVSDANVAPGSSGQTIEGRMIDVLPLKGDDFQALLPILPGVIRGPDGRINMKGGRPTQTGLQVSAAYGGDPTTGNLGFGLPADAIDSIEVLPNPYTAEYGRFSAGLTKIETRRGGDRWVGLANDFIPVPCLKLCDGKNFGVRNFDPRAFVGGPLRKGRLFFFQSAQFRAHRERVPSLPDPGSDSLVQSLDTFTRLDLRLGRQLVTGTVALFPKSLDFVNLNTFNPQPVTPNFQQRGFNAAITATTRFSEATLLDTTVNFKRYDVEIAGQGRAEMRITPDGNRGNFFNRQERQTSTLQWIGSLSFVRKGFGVHVTKIGVDVLRLRFTGVSESLPVQVVRENGTLGERIDFGGPSAQHVGATDLGAFVQDGWRLNDRLLVELGTRIDRDGVIGRMNASPRFGASVAVLADSRGVLRGGAGRFYERTALLAGAFETMEARTTARFAADGLTLVAPPVALLNRTDGPLRTALGRTWNIEYDHRIASNVVIKVGHLERSGRNELLIQPRASAVPAVLSLTSGGRSHYRETEVTLRHAAKASRGMTLTYVRSRSEADLNAFDTFFGNFRHPVIRPNDYSLTNVDVPNRLIALATIPAGMWSVAPLLELRNGFPYSVVDQDQNFVGMRNTGGRFPVFYTLDLNISRAIVVRKRHLRIGLRINHLLNNGTPRDVQANIDSPEFGTFSNSLIRRIGLRLAIEP